MLCARVMRGINSMARKVTPRSASERAASIAVSGSPKPMTVCPRRISARSAAPVSGFAPGARTCSSTSAAAKTSSRDARRTPFSAYSESGKPARTPAPDSIRNSTPDLFRTPSAPGTIATRRSPGADSATTPTVMAMNFQFTVSSGYAKASVPGGRGSAGAASVAPAGHVMPGTDARNHCSEPANASKINDFYDEHLAYIVPLMKSGKVLSAGPTDDGRGVIVFATKDWSEAEAIMKKEPFTREGIMKIASHTVWHACEAAK